MPIRTVGVLGCGLMGSGIAEVCAKAGYETRVREVTEELTQRGRRNIEKSLGRAVEKGKLEGADRDAALARLHSTTSLDDLADCDLIIEAVIEDLAAKNEMWAALDRICGPDVIFASNTSSLPMAAMAAATRRPDRFLGLHFFNPVPVMKLVEIVRSIATSNQTYQAAAEFVKTLGKETVVSKDTPGFIVNRLLVPYMLDSIRLLEQGGGSVEDIDKAMVLGTGHPMGPFVLGDFVGLDTLLRIGDIMFDEFRDARYAVPPLLRRMIEMGYYGRKSGRGFYDYSGEKPVPTM